MVNEYSLYGTGSSEIFRKRNAQLFRMPKCGKPWTKTWPFSSVKGGGGDLRCVCEKAGNDSLQPVPIGESAAEHHAEKAPADHGPAALFSAGHLSAPALGKADSA
jgi:hypothetical protein